MLYHYLTIAFRNIKRSKVHSIINILGLSLGIACFLLIALFVKDEWTFDTFHSKSDRIYRVWLNEDYGPDEQFFNTVTPLPMGPILLENFNEIEQEVRFNSFSSLVQVKDEKLTQNIAIAGEHFFEVFDFDFISGDRYQVLKKPDDAVITENIALQYFGSTDVLGKNLSIQISDEFRNYTIVAVTRNIPSNSSINYEILLSDLNYPMIYSERMLTSLAAWFNVIPETYVLVNPEADIKGLEKKLPNFFKNIFGEEFEGEYNVGFQPLTDIHLNTFFPEGIAPVNDPRYPRILASIAILLLLIGSINYVTLSIGGSMKRSKEVGIRKVSGAARLQLIRQFIGESLIITLISLFIGIILAFAALNTFNTLAGKSLTLEPNAFLFGLSGFLLLFLGLVAGSYPAFILSGFKPVSILKGKITTGDSKQNLRKVLVGMQILLSVFLVSSTLIMQKQLEFIRSKNLGYNKEQLVMVQLNTSPGNMTSRIKEGFSIAENFKTELLKHPEIISVSTSSHAFGVRGWTNLGYTDESGSYRTFNLNSVDADYISNLDIEMADGRSFDKNNPADLRRSIVVNEALVKEYGWESAMGKQLPGKNFQDHEIIGVVRDFNYNSLYTKIEPLVLAMDPSPILAGLENIGVSSSPVPKLMIRIQEGVIPQAIEKIELVWKSLAQDQEFSFSFVDESLAALYAQDQNLNKIVRVATLIAILISSLGLYALASLALQNRNKEISIRKVFGASQRSLMLLMSKDYILLVLICLVISIPFTIYLMNRWLQTFEYKVEITWDIFLLTGLIISVLAIVVISYHIVKNAYTSPTTTLKYD